MIDDSLRIGDFTLNSRLILGTGRHRTSKEMVESITTSGTDVITVAIRRLDLENPGQSNILDLIDQNRYKILPNTAGCRVAEEALLTANLARSLGLPNWVKLEVIPDPKYLMPDPIETMKAAELLIAEGFMVLPYIHADPVLAKRLEAVGCSTVMPLGSAIGSGQGIHTVEELQIIIEQASVPVIVDAGLGVPSDAAKAMEMGAAAVLVNTAIARANRPILMAEAFKLGVEAGRKAFHAGRAEKQVYAQPSSPLEGVIGST